MNRGKGYIGYRRLINYICLMLVLSILTTSCATVSKNNAISTNNEISSSQIIEDETVVSNASTQALNNKLGNIKDDKTAEDAVNEFINYMATRFEEPNSNLASQSVAIKSNQSVLKEYINVNRMAKQELAIRKGSLAIQSAENTSSLISASELAKQINSQNKDVYQVSAEEISTIRDAVRESMPNLATDSNNPLMSELEASIIIWTYGTGDDGSMAAGSIPLEQPLSDVLSQSLENSKGLKTQAIQWVAVVVVTLLVVGVACGVNYTVQQVYSVDIFGNKVHRDEEIKFCWKEKRGRGCRKRWVKRWDTRIERSYWYSYEDLLDAANYVKPYVDLKYGSNPNGLALLDNNNSINIASAGSGLTISASNSFVKFPWSSWKFHMRNGDLIFNKSSRNDIVTKFSYLTHVAMLYNKKDGTVFESVHKPDGANIYDIGENWGNDKYLYTVRRVGGLSAAETESALKKSLAKYAGSKYRPDMMTPQGGSKSNFLLSQVDKIRYYSEWSDKHNTDGIYCSKLVWLTFKDVYNQYGQKIDLDSNATRIDATLTEKFGDMHNVLYQWGLAEVDTDDYGMRVDYAFKGVSPDDIFESKFLDPFFVLVED